MDDEWIESDFTKYSARVDYPHLTVYRYEDSLEETRWRVHISVRAYNDMGKPPFVKIYTSKFKDRIKLASLKDCLDTECRKVNAETSRHIRIAGLDALVKRRSMLVGRYRYMGDGVFRWEETVNESI